MRRSLVPVDIFAPGPQSQGAKAVLEGFFRCEHESTKVLQLAPQGNVSTRLK